MVTRNVDPVNPKMRIDSDTVVIPVAPGSNSFMTNEASTILDKSNQYLANSFRWDLSNFVREIILFCVAKQSHGLLLISQFLLKPSFYLDLQNTS